MSSSAQARAALAVLAKRQHGVFTRSQALAVGLSRHQVDHGVTAGRHERVAPATYRLAGAPDSWEQRLSAAVLAAGPGALASHRSAAYLWGLDGARRGVVELSVPRPARPDRRSGVRVHESTDLWLAGATEREGIPVTGLVRTLVDLGAVVPTERLSQAVDDAVRRRFTTWDEIARIRTRHGRKGRDGVGVLRELLEVRYGTVIPDSHFGRLVADLLVDAGLPPPEIEHDIHDGGGRWLARADLAYPGPKVAIELDSKKYHLGEEAFEADRPRQNRLELWGWTVLRYTWRFYSRHPERLCTEVAEALRYAGEP